jgi:hypothetical protein
VLTAGCALPFAGSTGFGIRRFQAIGCYIFRRARNSSPAGHCFAVAGFPKIVRLSEPVLAGRFVVQQGCPKTAMSGRAIDDEPQESVSEPATLFRVMQAALADGLKEHYDPPRKMSHQLFVLMMQMNDRAGEERAQAGRQARTKTKPGKRPDAALQA